MLRYVLKRVGFAVLSIWAVLTITFFIAYLAPGDPIEQMMGQHANPAALAAARHNAGLDKPPLARYAVYLLGLLHGDLGKSYVTNESVTSFLARSLPNTFALAVAAIVLAILAGIAIGLVASLKPNTFLDRFLMFSVLTGVSVPNFVLGPILILIFALKLGWLPVAGWGSPADFVLPAIVLGARPAALIARMTRSSMLETLKQDYIRTARAKGLSPGVILVKHALKNAFMPVLTTAGVSFGYLLTGSFVVETIFTIPGVGMESIVSLSQRDYTMIQGTTLVIAVVFVVVNLIIDLLYAALDPRVKITGGAT